MISSVETLSVGRITGPDGASVSVSDASVFSSEEAAFVSSA